MRQLKRIMSCFVGVVLLLTAANAQAISPEAEEKLLSEVCSELVCLCGCGNMVLSTCTCGVAGQRKSFLRMHIRKGKNKEQLLKIMADKYGEQVLAAPPKEGINWILWVVVPYLVPILGAFSLWFILAKWVKKRTDSQGQERDSLRSLPEGEVALHKQYEKQLEDELKDFDD